MKNKSLDRHPSYKIFQFLIPRHKLRTQITREKEAVRDRHIGEKLEVNLHISFTHTLTEFCFMLHVLFKFILGHLIARCPYTLKFLFSMLDVLIFRQIDYTFLQSVAIFNEPCS